MERFPSPRQETTPEDTADNDALREAYLQETAEQEESGEDADTAALREAYAQEATGENEDAAADAGQQESLSLEDQFNLPAISDEARNVDLPEGYSTTNETADADNAALREAYLQEETLKNEAIDSADTAALREAYTQEETRENERAAAEGNKTYGSGRRVNAYARQPETTGTSSSEAPRRVSTEFPTSSNPETPTRTTAETRGEGISNDVLKSLLAQNQELANAVRDLTARLNRVTEAAPAINRTTERTPNYNDFSGPELPAEPATPEYQRAHLAEVARFAEAEKEMIARKKNAEARKAERKRIRRLERQAKKAERKDSRSEWQINASKKVWAIGKAALGKLSGRPSGWTTGKNAPAARKLN